MVSSNSEIISDSLHCVYGSFCAAKDIAFEGGPIENPNYFEMFSYQLGYTLFNELIFRLWFLFSSIDTYLPLKIVNVIMLSLTYIIILLLNKEIFKNKTITDFTFIIMLINITPIIFLSFLYGFIPGLMFSMLSFLFLVKFMNKKHKNSRIKYLSFSLLFICISFFLKPNYLILVIVWLIVLGFYLINNINIKKVIVCIVSSIILICLIASIPQIQKSIYWNRDLGSLSNDSVPPIANIAMGLRDSSAYAPGWYDSYNVSVYEEAEHNARTTSDISKNYIKERVHYFMTHKKEAARFFLSKFETQWNETTYESFLVNQFKPSDFNKFGAQWSKTTFESLVEKHFKPNGVNDDSVFGKINNLIFTTDKLNGRYVLSYYMDYLAQYVFILSFISIVIFLTKNNYYILIYHLSIIGAMIYHLISEAKSQYSLVFYILISAVAAVGLAYLYTKIKNSINIRNFPLIFKNNTN